jgi:YbbR domain-containing protein
VRQRSQTIGTLGRSPARQAGPASPLPPPHEPGPTHGAIRQWLHGAVFDNTGLKFLSLILAVTVFLLVSTDKDHEINVRVPIKYDYPPDKVLVSDELEEVTVTIKGPWRVLKRYDHREIGRIRLDLMSAPTGEVAITPDLVTRLPPRLTVTSITPKSVRVAFDKKIEKIVEIAPVTTGSVDYGYVAVATKAIPAIVRVRGGERLLAALTQVRTSDIDLEHKRNTFDVQVGLVPPSGVELDRDQRVTVNVRIEEEMGTRKYPGRPVVVRVEGVDPPAPNAPKFTVDPPVVEVTLSGTILAVEAAKELPLIVRATPADTKAREAEVVIEGLPALVGKRISPERVKLTPIAPSKPASPPGTPGSPAQPVSPTSPAPRP